MKTYWALRTLFASSCLTFTALWWRYMMLEVFHRWKSWSPGYMCNLPKATASRQQRTGLATACTLHPLTTGHPQCPPQLRGSVVCNFPARSDLWAGIGAAPLLFVDVSPHWFALHCALWFSYLPDCPSSALLHPHFLDLGSPSRICFWPFSLFALFSDDLISAGFCKTPHPSSGPEWTSPNACFTLSTPITPQTTLSFLSSQGVALFPRPPQDGTWHLPLAVPTAGWWLLPCASHPSALTASHLDLVATPSSVPSLPCLCSFQCTAQSTQPHRKLFQKHSLDHWSSQ